MLELFIKSRSSCVVPKKHNSSVINKEVKYIIISISAIILEPQMATVVIWQ